MSAKSCYGRGARRGNQSARRLQFEPLERRMLLAGDTYLVNFQIDEATPVNRYLPDIGAVYGPPVAAGCRTVGRPATWTCRGSGAQTPISGLIR